MLGNIWLKIKVFFFISSVLALLSFFYFGLFDQLVKGLDIQQGAENTFRYLEQRVKNTQYELITQSFEIVAKLKVTTDKKTRTVSFDARAVDPQLLFAITDGDGAFLTGSFQQMTSLAGVPAVDRAIRDGVGSDGVTRVGNEEFLVGAVPFDADLGIDKRKRLIAVSFRPVREAFSSVQTTFPAQVFSNGMRIYDFKKDAVSALMTGPKGGEFQNAVEEVAKTGKGVTIDRWHRIAAFTMPTDLRATGQIVFVGFLSVLPGYDIYRKSVIYIAIYAAIAIFITLIFTFIITYDVDRGFKKLAADVSRLKVGEKLLLHKYSHGAGLVVSALNHMIGNYQKHDASTPGAMLSTLMSDAKGEKEVEIPEPSFDRKREAMPVRGATDPGIVRPAVPADPTEDEKTQLAGLEDIFDAPSEQAGDPFAPLWELYRSIKIKHGEKVTDQEKASFLAKLKTNRVSIMTKYNCKDVTFAIEEKDGKPVIKAKPVK